MPACEHRIPVGTDSNREAMYIGGPRPRRHRQLGSLADRGSMFQTKARRTQAGASCFGTRPKTGTRQSL